MSDEEDFNKVDNDPRDIRNHTVTIITMVSIVAFVVWVTYVGVTERFRIEQQLTERIDDNTKEIRRLDQQDQDVVLKDHTMLKEEVRRLSEMADMTHDKLEGAVRQQNEVIDRIKELLQRVRERQLYVIENIWTVEDHKNWCREAQIKNPNWTCPTFEAGNKMKFLLSPREGPNDSIQEDIRRTLEEDPSKLWQDPEPRHKSYGSKSGGTPK
jgi:hypothetical protein